MARVGRLLLRAGKWQGRRLIESHIIEEATTAKWNPGAGHYGLTFHVHALSRDLYPATPDDAYHSAGAGHQVLLVIPSLKLVAVRFGEDLGAGQDDFDTALNAHFVAPRGDPIHLSGDLSRTLIQLLDWGSDPVITGAFVATVLITENLADLHPMLVENPYSAKIKIELPTADEIADFVNHLTEAEPDFEGACEVTREQLAAKLVGLSRVNVRNVRPSTIPITKIPLLNPKTLNYAQTFVFGRGTFQAGEYDLSEIGKVESHMQTPPHWRRGRFIVDLPRCRVAQDHQIDNTGHDR